MIRVERNMGIECLRIVAMLMIICLHILGHGAALDSSEKSYISNLFIQVVATCAVDVYAIISGFVGYREENESLGRLKKYLKVWLQVVCYNFGITFLVFVLNVGNIGMGDVLESIFPVMTNSYWYFTAYTGVYLVVPLLNSAIKGLESRRVIGLLIGCFLVFSCYETFAIEVLKKDIFGLNGGYTFLWIAILYIIGAGIRKCEMDKKGNKKYIVIGTLVSISVTFCFALNIQGDSALLSYTSPLIVFTAILLVSLFANINIAGRTKCVVKYLAPLAFGVYLFHDNNLVRKYFMFQRFEWIAEQSVFSAPLVTVLCAIFIFIVGAIVEKTRIKLFELLKIDLLIMGIDKMVLTIVNRRHEYDT